MTNKSKLKELRESAMEYMGWEGEDMGELFTPTRRDMIDYLAEFAASESSQAPNEKASNDSNERPTKLAYYVKRIEVRSMDDLKLSKKVNEIVNEVRAWSGHVGPVRLVSVSNSERGAWAGTATVTIEHYEYCKHV